MVAVSWFRVTFKIQYGFELWLGNWPNGGVVASPVNRRKVACLSVTFPEWPCVTILVDVLSGTQRYFVCKGSCWGITETESQHLMWVSVCQCTLIHKQDMMKTMSTIFGMLCTCLITLTIDSANSLEWRYHRLQVSYIKNRSWANTAYVELAYCGPLLVCRVLLIIFFNRAMGAFPFHCVVGIK